MSKQVQVATCAKAADGGKQLAGASAREYLFTNNPLFTSDGLPDQTSTAQDGN